MKKAELEYLRKNAATGEVFNKQLISTQVETIYSLDKLRKQLLKLNRSINNSNKKSESLEKSNQRLQVAMFYLALFTAAITLFPISKAILEEIGISSYNLIIYSLAFTSALIGILAFLIGKEIEKWN